MKNQSQYYYKATNAINIWTFLGKYQIIYMMKIERKNLHKLGEKSNHVSHLLVCQKSLSEVGPLAEETMMRRKHSKP